MNLDDEQRMMIIRFAAIASAGVGWSGFISVLSSSPAVWFAVGTAGVTVTAALIDYASGANQAREAL